MYMRGFGRRLFREPYHPPMRFTCRRITGLCTLLTLLLAPAALADVIWTGTGAGRGLRQDVDLIGVEGSDLIFLINGNRASSPLERVQQIQIEGQAAFNEAEQAYSAGDWEKAVDGYTQSARRNPTDWVRQRAAERLIRAAQLAGRFDAAVVGFVQLALLNPIGAVGKEPDPRNAPGPAAISKAIDEVEAAVATRLEARQEKLLLTFLLNLQTASNDDAAAGVTVQRLAGLLGDDPGDEPEVFAQVLLGRSRLALSRKDPLNAAGLIHANAVLFTEPRQQSQALMLLARAAEMQARQDRERLLDAALAYMRVVAHFGKSATAQDVPEALLKVAQIHEQLNERDAAIRLYRDLAETYPESPHAAEGQKRLDSLAEEAAREAAPQTPEGGMPG